MSVSLDAWLAKLESRHPLGSDGIDLGLTRVRLLKDRLGQRDQFPVVLVAGGRVVADDAQLRIVDAVATMLVQGASVTTQTLCGIYDITTCRGGGAIRHAERVGRRRNADEDLPGRGGRADCDGDVVQRLAADGQQRFRGISGSRRDFQAGRRGHIGRTSGREGCE